ncbi:MAG: hypothetical protein PHP44_13410 [Kiritimatiellae bacterium]|nr:hypothetical protein [Kiritimatiellia bacterium]
MKKKTASSHKAGGMKQGVIVNRMGLYSLFALILAGAGCAAASGELYRTVREPADVRITGTIETPALRECSGLARSACSLDLFWTHNDSGDDPLLYLIDLQGRLRSTLRVRDAKAKDWEDLASGEFDGKTWLFVADIGDNKLKRKHVRIYVLEDPCGVEGALDRKECSLWYALRFQYEDGAHNAEALGVDPMNGDLYLVTKTAIGSCGVYRLSASSWREQPGEMQTARRVATLPWSRVTAMDIAPDGLRALVLTRTSGYEYERKPDESWAQAFAGKPDKINLPHREQGEAVCYDMGRRLILASESEQVLSPIWVVNLDGKTDAVSAENE